MKKRCTLAMVSPDVNLRSETFIEAQRTLIDADVKFYYKGSPPTMFKGMHLTKQNLFTIVQYELRRRLGLTPLDSLLEVPVTASFRREKIEVVLAQFGTTGVAILNTCKLLKLPLIVHFHGADASIKELLNTYHEEYLRMFDYATYIIAVSKLMQQRLIEMGAPAQKIIYNPCAPNDAFFQIQRDPQGKLFVGAGRFTDKKAPYYTILAFQKVLKHHPDAQLILAGTGELWDACRNLVDFLGLNNNVTLPGAYNATTLQEWFSKATAFVQHSLTPSSGDMEGTPVVVMEASAAGLPVISTFHAGIPDVIIDNVTGLLVKEHDIEGMANNMCKLLDNKELSVSMGQAGRKNIKENFSMQKHIAVLNELVNNCAKI